MMWLDRILGRSQIPVDTFEEAAEKISNYQLSQEEHANWSEMTNHAAWFDLPDAKKVVRSKEKTGDISADDASILKSWVKDGYVILNNVIPHSDIDELNAYVEDLLSTSVPNENITLLGYTLDKDKRGAAVPHRELMGLSVSERYANARLSPWRIHELWTQCEAAKRIYQNARLKEVASMIFDRPAYPRSTINFYLGSQQELHQDMSVFHVYPGNYLIGAWIALEDISADSGPLRYAPGTHKSSVYRDFVNNPQDTLRTCSLDKYAGYYKFTNKIAKRKGGAKQFLAKKGDVLLWHGMLVHGGSPVVNPDLTRKSMVIHYLTDGVDQTDKIIGPFNWG